MESILVATADPEKMESMTDLLSKRGYFVIPAGDLDLALSFLDSEMKIDAVIADYQLADFPRMMRSARSHAPAPPRVIAMSEHVSVTNYLDALSYGAFDFFFWPVRSCEFLRIIQAAVPQHQAYAAREKQLQHGAREERVRGANYFL